MKLRNWLPTKFLTEENPFISLSFEVGYRRLAVVVGDTIVFTMSNMIRADLDSIVFLCTPAFYRYQASGGLSRGEYSVVDAHTPVGFYQERGMLRYGDVHRAFTANLLAERRAYKARNGVFTREDVDRMHRTMNDPWNIYRRSSSMGFPAYMTKQMFEKQLREGMREEGFETMDYTVRKLLNNDVSGIPRGVSGHHSLTSMCRPSRQYRLTSQTGGCGVLTRLVEYAADQASRKVEANLAKKYYFTGEGMLPKDL